MFFKILRSDIHNGILAQWKKYLITFFLFMFFSFMFFLERRVVEYANPSILPGPATLGDYLFYTFVGSSTGEFSNAGVVGGLVGGRINIQMPTIWLLFVFWLLFMVLYYPYHELHGIGKHMLILSRQRTSWWFSKCAWAVLSVCAFFLIALAAVCATAFAFGATCDLSVSQYLVYDFVLDFDHVMETNNGMAGVLVLLIPVCSAMALLQMILSLVTTPVWGFSVMASYVFLSTYIQSPVFISNYIAAARSADFITGGFTLADGVLVSLLVMAASMLVGYIAFCGMDILNKKGTD